MTEREELLGEYLPWCEVVTVDPSVEVPVVRDSDDRIFLQLAISAADALVTGDSDLLSLAPTISVAILTPAALRAQLA